jgi:hypothetical protein
MTTELIPRACGHLADFTPHGDKFDNARRDKLRHRNCPACGILKNKADNEHQAKNKPLKRKDAVKMLPQGTVIMLSRDEGTWNAHLMIRGEDGFIEVQASSLLNVVKKIVDKWFTNNRSKTQPEVKPCDPC